MPSPIFGRHRLLSHVAFATAAVTLASVLTAGCAAPPDEQESGGSADAVTVEQIKPASAQALVENAPAVREQLLGAHAWHLYSVEASNKDGPFDGLIAYGTDAHGQVVWAVVLDPDHEDRAGIAKIGPDGKSVAANLTKAVSDGVRAELGNLRSRYAAAASQSLGKPALLALLSATASGGIGWLVLGGAGITFGVLGGFVLYAALLVVWVQVTDGGKRPVFP
jgi:hypothetical protein